MPRATLTLKAREEISLGTSRDMWLASVSLGLAIKLFVAPVARCPRGALSCRSEHQAPAVGQQYDPGRPASLLRKIEGDQRCHIGIRSTCAL